MTVMTWMLATAITLTAPTPVPDRQPVPISPNPARLVVPCDQVGALPRALRIAEKQPEAEIYLRGVCTGNFKIERGSIGLHGMTPDSGLAAPAGNPSGEPLLEVVDANVRLHRMVALGGVVGVLAHGADAEVFLGNVEVRDQTGIGLYADDGAELRLFETVVENSGAVGVVVRGNSSANVQRSRVRGHEVGLEVIDRSFLAISDSTVERNRVGGLGVGDRSDANVLGGEFRENGQIHLKASDWSRITLLFETTIGSEADSTTGSLGATRNSTVASYGTPDIYGNASVLSGASLRLGNTVLHGDLTAIQFADAHVRNAEITGSVACVDGSDVICRGTTTAGSFGCVSTSCGVPTALAIEHGALAAEEQAATIPTDSGPRSLDRRF